MKVYGVSVLIYRAGLILAIARRNDYNDWGLPGGRVEENETPEQAALREFKEEVGRKLLNSNHIFTRMCGDNLAMTFTGVVEGENFSDNYFIHSFSVKDIIGSCFELVNQEGEPPLAWKTPEEIIACPTFGEYNFNLFKSVGIVK